MTRIIIIEDEPHVSAALIELLHQVDASVQVQAVLPTVAAAVAYLRTQPEADLIFSDVQLSDGLSFNIFAEVPVLAPVVFITGYDKFMLQAFACNSIDYLLKPVGAEDLQQALEKYRRLQRHFSARQPDLSRLAAQFAPQKRARLLVKKGVEHVALPFTDIVLFFTENKLVYVVDKEGRKYHCDRNLAELEASLDATQFFRLNRQYIVNINYIRSFRAYERVKLLVELQPQCMQQQCLQHVLIVSQETAPEFRKWVAGL